MTDERLRGACAVNCRGFVLPFVLVTLLLVATLAGATSFASWRAVRSARLGFNGERALQGADEGLVASLAEWDAGTYAARPIGARWTRTVATTDLGAVQVTLARSGPLAFVIRGHMESRVAGAPDTAARSITRHVPLIAPAFPLRGALTAFGDIVLDGAALVDGLDTRSASDGCGAARDTMSVSGVHGVMVTAASTASIGGRGPVTSGASAVATLVADRMSFDSAWTVTLPRVQRTDVIAVHASVAPAPAWSARLLTSADSLPPASTIALGGTSTHTGMLLIAGNLVLTGSLTVEGLLVVQGSIDASAGTLIVDGAVIARDRYAAGSTVGDATRVRYSQCSVRRALAAVARPGNAPYATWIER